jgi:hypothetical protein
VRRNGGLAKWERGRRGEWGVSSPVFRAKCLAEFYQADKDCLIQLDWIDNARAGAEVASGERLMMVDVARHGDDDSAFCVRSGGKVLHLSTVHGADTQEVAGRAARIIRDFDVEDCRVDTIGIGAGVFDQLKKSGFKVREFKGSHRARKRDRFRNCRAETYWAVREAFREGEIDLSALSEKVYNRLIRELSAIRYRADDMGLLVIESKEDYKRRAARLYGAENARSPDLADALAGTYAPHLAVVFDYREKVSVVKRPERIAL